MDGFVTPCSTVARALGSGIGAIDWNRSDHWALGSLGIFKGKGISDCKDNDEICMIGEYVNGYRRYETIGITEFSRFTATSFGDDYLYFNGCALSWINSNGTVENTWRGVSGKRKEGSIPYREGTKDAGPLPSTATYLVDPSKIQRRFDKMPILLTSPKQMENGQEPRYGETYKYPEWAAGEQPGWGDFRIPLQKASGEFPKTRDPNSFYLHGSTNGWGSAGCIDVGTSTNCAGLVDRLVARERPIELYVDHKCNPWREPWIDRQ